MSGTYIWSGLATSPDGDSQANQLLMRALCRSGSGSAGSQLSAQLPEELRAALGPEGLRAAQGRDRGPASDDFFDRQLQLGSAARRWALVAMDTTQGLRTGS